MKPFFLFALGQAHAETQANDECREVSTGKKISKVIAMGLSGMGAGRGKNLAFEAEQRRKERCLGITRKKGGDTDSKTKEIHVYGNTIVDDDGTTYTKAGNQLFGSDGTHCLRYGNIIQCD